MSTLEAAFSQLPAPIQDRLGSMIRRVRRLLFIRGFCATLAVALSSLLGIMLIDASVTLFSMTSRWALSLSGLSITLVAAWWFLLRPLSRRFTLTQMARIIEIRHPELQERISTAVELLSSNDPESIKGSEELIGAVVDSAIVDVEAVDPKMEFKSTRTAKLASITLALAFVIGLALVIWPSQSWILLQRAVAPFLDIGNAYADSLEVDPGDLRVAKGEAVTITLTTTHKKLKRAEIRRLLEDGTESVERLSLISESKNGAKQFSIKFNQVEDDFSYRIRAGSALTQYYKVTTVAPPAIDQFKVEYDFPDYTNLKSKSVTTDTGEIRAVAHTRVTLTATPNKKIDQSRLLINERTDLGSPEAVDGKLQWQFDLTGGMNGNWQIDLTDTDGFTNQQLTYPLEVLPDKSPSVIVTFPIEKELRLRPTELLPVASEIVEDFGFKDASFLVTPVGGDQPEEIAIHLPKVTEVAGTYISDALLDLSHIKSNGNQQRIGVQVLVRDNRPKSYDGPGLGLSAPFFITLDANAKPLAQQVVEAKKKAIENQLQKAKLELERARIKMQQTEVELNRTEDISQGAMRTLDDFSEHTEKAREELDKVAAALDRSFLQELSDKAEKIANEHISKAREESDLIPITDSKEERIKKSQDAKKEIQEAISDIAEIAKAMRGANKEFEMISQLNDLANKQQDLANRAAEMSAEQAQREAAISKATKEFTQQQLAELAKQQMDQFRNQQEQVQEQLGKMLQQNPEALEAVLGVQQKRAEQLAEATTLLAQEQQELKTINEEATRNQKNKQDALREQLIEHLQKEQTKLASQMQEQSDVARDTGKSQQASASDSDSSSFQQEKSDSSGKLAEAYTEAKETAKNLGQDDLKSAAKSANQASETLTAAAEAVKPSAPDSNTSDVNESGDGSHTEASDSQTIPALSDLAQRQEALAEQIEMLRDGDLQQALSSIEAQIQADAQALNSETQALGATLAKVDQFAAKNAVSRAEQALNLGENKAGEAAQHLSNAEEMQDLEKANGQVENGELSLPARQAMQRATIEQRTAAQALTRASEALAASANSLQQSEKGMEPSDQGNQIADGGEMAEGFNEVTESAQSQDAQQAAQQSQRAAESLQQLARNAMKKLGSEGQSPSMAPSDQPNPNPEIAGEPDGSLNLNESGLKTTDADGRGIPPELEAMGISAEDWSRFKGALSGGNAAGIETELPSEYRELVGRYFQVIAKEAGKE
tara:strand:+ start:8321 stop:12007 length:3687 start_codon:yes stop_codon:yes gene_type:complete